MSILEQFKLFADYNRLMNQRILESACKLTDEQLKSDRGAFFKSVLGTLNHILVGDIIWLKRFHRHPAHRKALEYLDRLDQPESLDRLLFDDIEAMKAEREKIDEVIISWINGLSESDIDDYLLYENMAGISQSKPIESLISHLFLHQVHHRGQATTLMSQSGVDFGETDLLELIPDHSA
jgi:uncharacterized damage-inducible protein DinB